jgi:TPP-dependent pyruvate/acetoin dehydrogenase alpha subunit
MEPDDLSQIDEEVRRLIDEAVKTAKAASEPDPARDLLTDVYVSY